MACILDHKRYGSALIMNEKYIKSKNWQMKLRQTTVSWSFLVRMKDGNKSWTPLRVLKKPNPVDIVDYVLSLNINNDPAFSWWVPYTLRKRDFIISSIDSRIKKRTHKYGI